MDNTKPKSRLKKLLIIIGIPDVGIYIWCCGEDAETHNTQHTIISANVFDKLGNDRSVSEWIFDAVNGDVKTYGIELLDKTF